MRSVTALSAGAGHLGFTEGPVDLRDDSIAFTSMTVGAVMRRTADGLETLVQTMAGPTGLVLTSSGDLLIAQNSGFWGAPAHAPAGLFLLHDGQSTPLRTDVGHPNDLCFGPDGWVYFTDPVSPEALSEPVRGHVYACSIETGQLVLLDAAMLFPNGLAFDESGRVLYVAESFARRITVIELDGHRAASTRTWTSVEGGMPDGICLDENGLVYAAVGATDSIHVYDNDGSEVDRVFLGEGAYPSNCCFAGPRLDRLVVTAAGIGALIEVNVSARGLPLYPFR